MNLIDKWLEKFTRIYINFILCSVLGFSILCYIDNDEIEDTHGDNNWGNNWGTIELTVNDDLESDDLESNSNEVLVENKSYEIVKNLYQEIV